MIRLFRPRRPSERIATSFRWLEEKPFPTTRAPFYSALSERGAYVLTLAKSSYFAWESLADEQRFGDFALEAEVELDESNGHSAAGVLFRHVSDESFYSFLVSSRGNYRVDLLFNNHPMHLVEWTGLPEPGGDRSGATSRAIRVVGHGSRFTFAVDDEWVGEIEDEVLPAGSFGFAAQNFAGAGRGVFRLRRFAVEARPLEVEKEHLRWSYYLPVSPAARLRLAETLFASGSHRAAAVQLRKALKDRRGSSRERLLLASCYGRLAMYDDALAEIDRLLAEEPSHADARMERANLLYLSGRLAESRDWLRAGLADGTIASAPAGWNLLGNAEYGLGNWGKAVDAYLRAVERAPEMPLYLGNAARGLERAGRAEEAAAMYLRAARLLFAEESFDELSMIVPRVRALAPGNTESLALEAKMLYREGKTEEALAILQPLADSDIPDSAVHYLIGIILGGKGRREDALPRLARAAAMEPSFPLYQFRLAEALHLLGREPWPPLERALALAPDDPWANNLAGQLRMEAGDPSAAEGYLRRARDAAPAEESICMNLSEALSLSGRHEEALRELARFSEASGDSARLANQRGNLHARQGENARAVQEYETAIRMDPENPAYKENCAAACIEVDMVHRAEELLASVEPEHPSAAVYNLLGNVAVLKGERARAEAAFAAGLSLEPGNVELRVNLAMLHRERGDHEQARDMLLAVLAANPGHARAERLLARLRHEREQRLACATCGREWWAPKDLLPQPSIRVRGEPPAEAPAGRCPSCGRVYCVGCASSHLRKMRFYCPGCGDFLKLSDDPVKWLLARHIENAPSP
jgi:tetratricopeptide (TPR) repeat protein